MSLEPAIPRADDSQRGVGGLNQGREPEMPVDTVERVFGRLVTVRRRVLERPKQVRAGVGVAQRDVDQADTKLDEHTDQGEGLGQVGHGWLVVAAAPDRGHGRGGRAGNPASVRTFLVRKAIEDIQAGGEHHAGAGVANPCDDVADEPRSMVERAAVPARARPGRQQLVQEIAVTLLDVDEVKSDLMGEPRGRDVVIL